ncbi:MAG: M20 family metallopeptidase [Hyphomicrobiaceae bacterium]|nr:M20 family metallopeptidase [Hyphomicrobiaceae bacterium]
MLSLIEKLVNTDSNSRDKAGVDAAGEILKAHYRGIGLEPETIPHDTFGDAIRVPLPNPTANDQRPIVLMGHRDTVFPTGEVKRRPFRIDGDRAFGPGVADMKSGLVMNAFIVEAFKHHGGNPGPLVALITSDEEIASPSSRPVIEAEAREARVVFNAEPGRPTGNVVKSRKGGVFMTFEITGKAAHSGSMHQHGISAIEELAQKTIAIHKLTNYDSGITLNVGLIRGGQTVNTVAPWASGEIDMRYKRVADRDKALAAIRRIIDTPTVAGTTATLRIDGEFLSLEQTAESERLLALYQGTAAAAGLKVEGEASGGCADSGYTAAVGCPTICGVGPVGGKGHTPDEYLEIETIVPRAQATALAIMRLADAEI